MLILNGICKQYGSRSGPTFLIINFCWKLVVLHGMNWIQGYTLFSILQIVQELLEGTVCEKKEAYPIQFLILALGENLVAFPPNFFSCIYLHSLQHKVSKDEKQCLPEMFCDALAYEIKMPII